jgi:hypothetical protein
MFIDKTRFRASFIHLCISGVVGISLLVVFWFVWYPPPLFQAVGGSDIFLMLLGIDVVLGPMLTFIVFKKGKKSLAFDLLVIGIVQAVALAYGVFALFVARPVYVAALGHRFDVVQANDVDSDGLRLTKKTLPLSGPVWIGTKRADDSKERERIMFSAIGGIDYGHFPQHHQPIENMRDDILQSAQKLPQLKALNPGKEEDIDSWIYSHGVKSENVRFQGLRARAKDFTVMLDATTAKVIGIAPFKPWL